MDFYLGRSDWKTLQRGEEHSFLLVNGLGGYCSQTVIGSNARHDHNLLTAALVAPTKRFAMVRRIEEILHVGSNAYRLDSQAYVTSTAFFMTDCLLGNTWQRVCVSQNA